MKTSRFKKNFKIPKEDKIYLQQPQHGPQLCHRHREQYCRYSHSERSAQPPGPLLSQSIPGTHF